MDTALVSLPDRRDLTLAQRMLASGAAPDLIAQAIGQGLFEGEDLNRLVGSIPLSQAWASTASLFLQEDNRALLDTRPDLAWPVDTDPSQIPLSEHVCPEWEKDIREFLWEEHVGILLVKMGMDPLQPWSQKKKKRAYYAKEHENLLDWASKTGRPWLLRACLSCLPENARKREAQRVLESRSAEGEQVKGTRLHEAMGHVTPLIAQVWHEHGTDLHAPNEKGETPVFLARSLPSLQWALEQGASLTETSANGTRAQEVWRKNVSHSEEWVAMQEAANLSKEESLAVLSKTIEQADVDGFKESFATLEEPSRITLASGRGLMGQVAHLILQEAGVHTRRRWSKDMGKILHFLWSRMDLESVHARKDNPFLTERDLAWTASQSVEGLARQAARMARRKHGFSIPDPKDVVRWAQHALSDELSPGPTHAWASARSLATAEATSRSRRGKMGEEDVAEFAKILNDTSEGKCFSVGEAREFAELLIPSLSRQLAGTEHLSPQTRDRFLAELVRASCRELEGNEYLSMGDPAAVYSTDLFRKLATLLEPERGNHEDPPLLLSACITALLDEGAIFPQGEGAELTRQIRKSGMEKHPIFGKLDALFALCLQCEMDAQVSAAQPAVRTRTGPRF